MYKSFELDPLAKLAVESGEIATVRILDTLEYLASLTIPRDLSWLGIDIKIPPMDLDTFYYVRDSPVFSAVIRTADHGVAHQYGKILLEGEHANQSLVAAASAISVVQESPSGDIQIYRKKQFGIENKHGKELIPEFHNVKSDRKQDVAEKKSEHEVISEFGPGAMDLKEPDVKELKPVEVEQLPVLKSEDTPVLKVNAFVDTGDMPWDIHDEKSQPPLKVKAVVKVDEEESYDDEPWS